jgi:DNA-binding winged helix-turn-helix (wHTH) protein
VKIRFASCTLDTNARRLFRGAGEVHLSPKAFELLKLLVETRPRALSKAELLEHVWPGVFVADASLAKVVTEIRQGIGDRARPPRIVRTVHGYGYAFVAESEEEEPRETGASRRRSHYWLICGSREFALVDGEQFAGRDPDLGIWLDSPKISRRHARFVVAGVHTTVEDLGSKNGTFVRGVRIVTPTALESGDEIRMGPFTLLFRVTNVTGPTETQVSSRPPD